MATSVPHTSKSTQTKTGHAKKRQTRKPSEEPPLFAALDLGTNSCRMLIATPNGSTFRVVDAYSKSVRLGIDLERTGALSRRAINRTLSALQVCADKISGRQLVHSKFVATEACRRAENGDAFLDEVRTTTGLELEVIRPSEEARLAVVSCAPLVSADAKQVLIIDIGGGSTELVWMDLRDVAPEMRLKKIMKIQPTHCACKVPKPGSLRVVDWISVPVGVATLYEKFRDVEDDKARFALMSWYFEEQIAEFQPYKDAGFATPIDGFEVIGTSGTVTTVGAAHLKLPRYDRSKVDGLQMRSEEVNAVVEEFLALGPAGRRAHPGIGRDRTRLIMAGSAILQTLLTIWPSDKIRVADRGLREGMLYSMMAEAGLLESGG